MLYFVPSLCVSRPQGAPKVCDAGYFVGPTIPGTPYVKDPIAFASPSGVRFLPAFFNAATNESAEKYAARVPWVIGAPADTALMSLVICCIVALLVSSGTSNCVNT